VQPMHLQYFCSGSLQQLLEDHGFRVVSTRRHPKAFPARYYAERLGGYRPSWASGAVGALRVLGLADRVVMPDLHDRLEMIAISR
jgi:hypothetical protein